MTTDILSGIVPLDDQFSIDSKRCAPEGLADVVFGPFAGETAPLACFA